MEKNFLPLFESALFLIVNKMINIEFLYASLEKYHIVMISVYIALNYLKVWNWDIDFDLFYKRF